MSSPFVFENEPWNHIRAVEQVGARLLRALGAMEANGVCAAVVGANAVGYWVGTKDPGAIRNTPNVDFLIRRDEFPAAKAALQQAEFVHVPEVEETLFVDGPKGKPRSGVRLLFANEKVRPDHLLPAPDLAYSLPATPFRVVTVPLLVQMKLVAYRTIDRVHLQDMVRVGLIDDTWPGRFPPVLAERLRAVLADPDG